MNMFDKLEFIPKTKPKLRKIKLKKEITVPQVLTPQNITNKSFKPKPEPDMAKVKINKLGKF